LQFDIFSPKTRPLFGMDISNSDIRLVELSDAGKGDFKLERYTIEPIARDAITDGNINNVENVTSAILRALKRFNSPLKYVAIGIPSASIINKMVSMPGDMSPDDLEYQVIATAEQYIPFNISEVNLDFQIIGSSDKNPDEIDLLLSAVRKEKLEERVVAIDMAKTKLRVAIVDDEGYAKMEAVNLIAHPKDYKNKCVAYVQVDFDSVSLIVFHNGQSVFTRDQSFGIQYLTTEIMHRYDLSSEAAEAMRIHVAHRPDDYNQTILVPFYDMIAQEIQRSLQMFITSTPYSQADVLVLGGEIAAAADLTSVISSQIKIPLLIANPFSNMQISNVVSKDDLLRDAPSLLTACGLALRRFDDKFLAEKELLILNGLKTSKSKGGSIDLDISQFRSMMNLQPYREEKRAADKKQFVSMISMVAVLGLSLSLLIHGIFSGYVSAQEAKNSFITAENDKLDNEIIEIKRLKSDIDALISRKQVIEALQSDRAQAIQILDQMVRISPPGLYLTSMKQTDLKVEIKGFAPSSDQVSAFMVNVQNSPYLEKPELVEIKATFVGVRRLSEFNLNFYLSRPKVQNDKDVKPITPMAKTIPISTGIKVDSSNQTSIPVATQPENKARSETTQEAVNSTSKTVVAKSPSKE
jgi:type IV pilus assembly protein PilM